VANAAGILGVDRTCLQMQDRSAAGIVRTEIFLACTNKFLYLL
jgi:hypothetical protein